MDQQTDRSTSQLTNGLTDRHLDRLVEWYTDQQTHRMSFKSTKMQLERYSYFTKSIFTCLLVFNLQSLPAEGSRYHRKMRKVLHRQGKPASKVRMVAKSAVTVSRDSAQCRLISYTKSQAFATTYRKISRNQSKALNNDMAICRKFLFIY